MFFSQLLPWCSTKSADLDSSLELLGQKVQWVCVEILYFS